MSIQGSTFFPVLVWHRTIYMYIYKCTCTVIILQELLTLLLRGCHKSVQYDIASENWSLSLHMCMYIIPTYCLYLRLHVCSHYIHMLSYTCTYSVQCIYMYVHTCIVYMYTVYCQYMFASMVIHSFLPELFSVLVLQDISGRYLKSAEVLVQDKELLTDPKPIVVEAQANSLHPLPQGGVLVIGHETLACYGTVRHAVDFPILKVSCEHISIARVTVQCTLYIIL